MFTISNTPTYEMTHPGQERARVSKREHFGRSSVSKRANPLIKARFEVVGGSYSLQNRSQNGLRTKVFENRSSAA